jgi:ABC-three component (ABC-3C) system Middle Component 8
MLKPTKHLDPSFSVLNVAAQVLSIIAKQRTIKYDELYDKLEKRFGDNLRPVFLPSISFLYLVGKVEYHTKNDTFEYRTS